MHRKRSLNPIPSSQDWACGPSACTYVLVFLTLTCFSFALLVLITLLVLVAFALLVLLPLLHEGEWCGEQYTWVCFGFMCVLCG